MLQENYITLKENGHAQIVIRKSEFICSLARVTTEEEAQAFIAQVRKEHYKATHNCFAYVLGMHDEIQRQSDDDEPSGTAGVPILKALQNLAVRNVCAVVTRYFGGIKLGAGGLIRAYSNATSHALTEIGLVRRVVQQQVFFTIAYPLLGKLQNYLENKHISIIDTQFTDQVTLEIAIDEEQSSTLQQQVYDFLNAQVTITTGDLVYNELPYDPHQT
ncbi:YigZ family protein [Ligilactobacillus saerimneri]|uniref:YigZ family protein n=1 Tax=Ligilactobacillus saerimneri TaxID=228229 RepID=A0A7H9EIF9_9LACO|nr:YigZ family protein [Ligilactobacillus saerimneri]QLL77493.1 YigZ family protein [Ligilactobacillus saerimneri]